MIPDDHEIRPALPESIRQLAKHPTVRAAGREILRALGEVKLKDFVQVVPKAARESDSETGEEKEGETADFR